MIYADIPQLNIDQNKIQKDINDYTERSRKRIDDIKNPRESLITNDSITDIDFTEFESEKTEYEQADIDLPNYEVYSCIFLPNLSEEEQESLTKLGVRIEDYPNIILNEYRKWILNGIKSYSIMNIYKENPWSFWHQYKHLVPEKSIFANFCLRFLSISATSACCERSFHDINLEMPPDRMRTSEQLLRHRINVRKHNDVLQITI